MKNSMQKYTLKIIALTTLLLVGCVPSQGIITGDKLDSDEIVYLQEIQMLETDEQVIMFSSQLDFESSGNFFTNNSVASYWIYDQENTKHRAEYEEITDITASLDRGSTFASEIIVTLQDGSSFSIYIDDDSAEAEETFYDTLVSYWKTANNVTP